MTAQIAMKAVMTTNQARGSHDSKSRRKPNRLSCIASEATASKIDCIHEAIMVTHGESLFYLPSRI